MHNQDLKLTDPTDFDILSFMNDGKRHQPPEIAAAIGHKDQYVRNRISNLRGLGLVENIPNSSMYVLTEKGRVTLDLQDQYDHSRTQEFAREVEEELSRREGECQAEEGDANVGV
jgi:predicted transcriptional regulator